MPILPSLTSIPSTLMDKANTKIIGNHSLSELVVLVGTVVSALLTILNHYHHNSGHRTYCLAVTGVGIILYLSMASARRLGDQNRLMEDNLQKFSTENDRYASLNAKLNETEKELRIDVNSLTTSVDNLNTVEGALTTLKDKLGDAADLSKKSATVSKESATQVLQLISKLSDLIERCQQQFQVNPESKIKIQEWLLELSNSADSITPKKLREVTQQISNELKIPPGNHDTSIAGAAA